MESSSVAVGPGRAGGADRLASVLHGLVQGDGQDKLAGDARKVYKRARE